MNRTQTLTCALVFLLSGIALADAPQDERPHKRPPPQAALDACAALTRGDTCAFEDPHGIVEGQCRAPTDRPLACAPERLDDCPHHRPPGDGSRDDDNADETA